MNPKEIKAPFLKYEHIRPYATNFLNEYWDNSIPVDIEKIVDNRLGLDIVPVPNLFREHDMNGCISKDLMSIYVDEYDFNRVETRHRFTLAHEVGHLILHKDIFTMLSYKNIIEWKKAIQKIDRKQLGWLDVHANAFAGLVLVPSGHLSYQRNIVVEKIRKSEFYDDSPEFFEMFKDFVLADIGRIFNVSGEVIRRRLEYENLPIF